MSRHFFKPQASIVPDSDAEYMDRAIELARRGQGFVEPNPMVGALVVRDGQIVGEGWHPRFGGRHAEIEALAAAGGNSLGATLYVTLEPCGHHGKTPPCTDQVIAAGIHRVVIAHQDPFPEVSGRGISALQAAGIDCQVGVLEHQARQLNAPYLKLIEKVRPWVIAKWAMTLDGKMATAAGMSQWISGEESRAVVHELRGRVDAIIVGRGTVQHDDPMLTARPSGARVATRIVLDTQASLPIGSRLVRTARETPVLIATGPSPPKEARLRLLEAGCEVFLCEGESPVERLGNLLSELGRRRLTNVLVEGGGRVLGSFFDAGEVDEVHCFIGPLLLGDAAGIVPFAGRGVPALSQAWQLDEVSVRQIGRDIYVSGRSPK